MSSSRRNCSGPAISTMPFTGEPDGDPADRAGDVVGRHRLDERGRQPDRVAVGGVRRRCSSGTRRTASRGRSSTGSRSPRSASPGRPWRGSSRSRAGDRCRPPTARRDARRRRPPPPPSRLRVDVSKNSSTAASSNEGEFDTSTTTDAPAKDLGQSLAGERVDARVGRRRDRLVAVLVELGHELRSDEAGAADDDDLHVVPFACVIRVAPCGVIGGAPARTGQRRQL